jgi:hypothetical protein
MDTPTARYTMDTFRFLDLPPELRNSIYTILLNGEKSLGERRSRCDNKSNTTRSSSLSLSQAKKLLREECYPLFQRNLCVRVDFFYLQRFLDAFYPLTGNVSLCGGSICVTAVFGRSCSFYLHTEAAFDILPLLRLLHLAPGLSATSQCWAQHHLNLVLQVRNSTWRDNVLNRFERVCVFWLDPGREYMLPLWLCVWYKEGQSPEWLPRCGMEGYEGKLSDFSRDNGLPEQDEVRVSLFWHGDEGLERRRKLYQIL